LAQLYKLKTPSTEKLVNSKITLHVDPSTNLITQYVPLLDLLIELTGRHDEEWDGKPNTTSEDGFFGALNEFRKKATATLVKAGVDTTPADQKK